MSHTTLSMIALTLLGPPTGGLSTHESKFYKVETEVPADRAAFVGQVMDATGKEYARRFQRFRGSVRQKPAVRVYANKENFLAALARACGEPNENARGTYCPLDGIVYTYDGEHLERILKHECFHQFAHQTVGGRLPRWTDEGLAEYFAESRFDAKTGQLQLGAAPAWRLQLLREARQNGELFTVDQLRHIGGEQWRDNMRDRRGDIQYSQVWLLCHFLIHAEGGKYLAAFEDYLGHLDRGLDADSAFKRVFGDDTRPLDKKLEKYLDNLKPKGSPP